MKWNIGCSGFSYHEWTGFFYPENIPRKEWLAFYASNFNTVEINSTFYKTPTLALLKNLYNKTPADFCFVIKAPKLITHTHQFINCEKIITEFYSLIKNGLMEKAGPILFQLPPSYNYNTERLDLILKNLDNSFKNVIEFRHKSWWNETVYQKLAENNISFCGVSYPGLPSEPNINTDLVYYRFHGVPKLYYSMYQDHYLRNLIENINKVQGINKVYLLFNNTASRAALENASFVQEYLSL